MFEFPSLNNKYNTPQPKSSRLYRNPVAVAQEWQNALAKGECSSQADLARKLGVSRARATQILRLLTLAPEVLETIAGLGDPLPSPIITERKLRPLISLPPEAQKGRIKAISDIGKEESSLGPSAEELVSLQGLANQ